MTTVESLKNFCVALGYGTSAADYEGENIETVFKELAVKMGCALSIDAIKTEGVAATLQYIADNKGEEEKEPYDLIVTATHATVKVMRKKTQVEPGADVLWKNDKLTITAVADEGYEITALTVNGEDFTSGSVYVVSGKVTIVCTAEEVTP